MCWKDSIPAYSSPLKRQVRKIVERSQFRIEFLEKGTRAFSGKGENRTQPEEAGRASTSSIQCNQSPRKKGYC